MFTGSCSQAYNLDMTQEARELLQKALALPENERAELAGNLISSLDATVDQDVDATWQQEVGAPPAWGLMWSQSRWRSGAKVPVAGLLEGSCVMCPGPA